MLLLLLCSCGRDPAHRGPDPLHADGIGLPPKARWTPPEAPADSAGEAEDVHVPPPRFSSDIFPCSRCHVGGQPRTDEGPALAHRPHLERDLACLDCHDPEETGEPAIPEAETCFECHENLAEEPKPVRDYFDRVRTKDDKYAFPNRWKTRDVIPAHKKHADKGVACTDCHGTLENRAPVKPRSVPLMERCVGCHQKRGAPTKCATCHKEIREPQHKNIVLKHAEEQRGCLDCHSRTDRDVLHLVNGTTVSFTESYKLCGQCHGPKLRDWKLGIHGKRTGMWDGKKEYLLCVHCHTNPHQPAYPKLVPDPPPARPEDIK